MPGRSPLGVVAAVLWVALAAAPARAVPPANDAPQGAAAFEPYAAANGSPGQLQAAATFAEAMPDTGVPRCLGPASFARTVWYRVPEALLPTELTVEATGKTLDVVDLAAFVQPAVPTPVPAPTPVPTPVPVRAAQAPAPLVREPNACAGAGAGGSDAAEEPTAGVTLRVPPGRPVLVQVGRRGALADPALVTLETDVLEAIGTPRGDVAKPSTPTARSSRDNLVGLGGATLTDEDPAQPACPSLGTVWRRVVPGSSGRRLISVSGFAASTLTVFAGSRPTADNALDCVNRERAGVLEMVVPVLRRRTLWIRIGADRTRGGEQATLRVDDGSRATVIDGGPGGFDPTTGGPGGGFPALCDRADVTDARVSGPRLRGRAGARNAYIRVPVRLRVRGASICDAEMRLYGPRGHIYAKGRSVRLPPGSRTVRLPRLRTFRRGLYRLEVKGVTLRGRRAVVRGSVRGRLR